MSSSKSQSRQLFHVPYSGDIQSVDSRSVHFLASHGEDEVVARVFANQIERLANRGLIPDYVVPARAGGLIVMCEPGDVGKIYDAVFGSSSPARPESRQGGSQYFNAALAKYLINDFIAAVNAVSCAEPLTPVFNTGSEDRRPVKADNVVYWDFESIRESSLRIRIAN